ncbi:MAG: leucine--tRNA ligase, partial [Candidatus Thorarchaeota archaeon]
METYDYRSIEEKWQKKWVKAHEFESDKSDKEKYFINFPIPYINGAPHLGHGYSLMKVEVMARYKRMLGKNVLFPFAFHATGEPIVGMAKRIKAGDERQKKSLMQSGVPEDEISKFEDPKYIIKYFRKKWTDTIKSLGLAIDWRRQFVTTQLTPEFSKFIEWQYRKLKRDGYVIQGSHPVIWCPADKNPTGDHDRLEGVGARIVDFVVIKFYSKKLGAYLLPATLRPETIFGVTNMFIHPKAKYVKVTINGEPVIIAEEAIIKFKDQKFIVSKIEDITVKELIGSYVTNPINNEEILVLPGDFIDSGGSTGVVMSVPGHAPVDWITLIQMKEEYTKFRKWGIDKTQLLSIKPISLIEVEGYGEFPAGEAIESMGITSSDDPKVKDATKLIYRKEHRSGKLKSIAGKYAGKKIEGVKEKLIADFEQKGIAFRLKEPGEPVVCRCGTRNHVKFLENQWFLEFSNPKWKQKTHDLIDNMNIFPEETRIAFHNTVDWLENKACARRSGLGTPMPWDTDWIIETLSDSVIYMAYYIISKYVNSGDFKEKYAIDQVYDYILMGTGDPQNIHKEVGIPVDLLKSIREELKYFYGFDLRSSGKDLLNNHLTFMLMHHTAIFPKEFLPKGVAVNGYVSIIKPGATTSEKMSKSKGNFQTIEDVISQFGVDATRLIFLIAGEGMKDAQLSLNEADNYIKWIQTLYSSAFEEVDDLNNLQIDRWLISRIQNQIKKVRNHLSRLETRSAFQAAYHEIMQDIKWYSKRRGNKGPAYKYAIETIVKLVCPFIPHVVEEIWEKWGNDRFASSSIYPQVDESLIDKDAEYAEKFLASFLDDVKGLKKYLKDKGHPYPKTIEVFVAPEWMFEVYNEAYKGGLDNLIKRVMQNPEMRKIGSVASSYAQNLIKEGGPPDFPWKYDLERISLYEALEFLEKELKAKIEIIKANISS